MLLILSVRVFRETLYPECPMSARMKGWSRIYIKYVTMLVYPYDINDRNSITFHFQGCMSMFHPIKPVLNNNVSEYFHKMFKVFKMFL